MNSLVENDIISMPVGDQRTLFRVLKIWRNYNNFVAIPIEPKKSCGRTYFSRHQNFKLNEIEFSISSVGCSVRLEQYTQRTELLLNDEELQKRFPPKKGTNTSRQILIRDERWDRIQPVMLKHADNLYDVELFPQLIKKYSQSNSLTMRQAQQIKDTLYQYFAGGLKKNSLLPIYAKCGARGEKRKVGTKKLGRPNAPTQTGAIGFEGYILKENDLEIIEHCWNHFVRRDVSVNSAYLQMCREFYAIRSQDTDWKVTSELLLVNERPTEKQFNYQGTKLSGKGAKQKQLKHNEFIHRLRPLFANANDGITAIGQQGAIDSTSTDVQLCSMLSRLDRVGFAHRELLVDSLYGYISGFYMGLSSPSSSTVKLAALHAMSDKSEWLKNLGLEEECPVKDWIPIQFAHLLSDNGELRCEEINQVFLDSGMSTSLSYIPSYQSDKNSIVESMHRRMHKLSDHKLLGSTYGRRSERGEEQASIKARHTLYEAIKDSARWVHHHNTTPQPDTLLTLEMQKDDVKPTPLDMTRWAIQNGHIACNLMDIDEAKINLVPMHQGVFTANGVQLLRPNTGSQRIYIRCLRYVSQHKTIANNMEKARSTGIVDGNFLVDIFNLNQIWFKDIYTAELIPLDIVTKDVDLKEKGTWSDVMAIEIRNDVDRFHYKDEKNSALSSSQEKQQQMKDDANHKYDKTLSETGGKLSKAKISGDRKENRVREMDNLLNGVPIMVSDTKNTDTSSVNKIKSNEAATHGDLIKLALKAGKS